MQALLIISIILGYLLLGTIIMIVGSALDATGHPSHKAMGLWAAAVPLMPLGLLTLLIILCSKLPAARATKYLVKKINPDFKGWY